MAACDGGARQFCGICEQFLNAFSLWFHACRDEGVEHRWLVGRETYGVHLTHGTVQPLGGFQVAHISFFLLQACEDKSHLAQRATIRSRPEAIHHDLQGLCRGACPASFYSFAF